MSKQVPYQATKKVCTPTQVWSYTQTVPVYPWAPVVYPGLFVLRTGLEGPCDNLVVDELSEEDTELCEVVCQPANVTECAKVMNRTDEEGNEIWNWEEPCIELEKTECKVQERKTGDEDDGVDNEETVEGPCDNLAVDELTEEDLEFCKVVCQLVNVTECAKVMNGTDKEGNEIWEDDQEACIELENTECKVQKRQTGDEDDGVDDEEDGVDNEDDGVDTDDVGVDNEDEGVDADEGEEETANEVTAVAEEPTEDNTTTTTTSTTTATATTTTTITTTSTTSASSTVKYDNSGIIFFPDD